MPSPWEHLHFRKHLAVWSEHRLLTSLVRIAPAIHGQKTNRAVSTDRPGEAAARPRHPRCQADHPAQRTTQSGLIRPVRTGSPPAIDRAPATTHRPSARPRAPAIRRAPPDGIEPRWPALEHPPPHGRCRNRRRVSPRAASRRSRRSAPRTRRGWRGRRGAATTTRVCEVDESKR